MRFPVNRLLPNEADHLIIVVGVHMNLLSASESLWVAELRTLSGSADDRKKKLATLANITGRLHKAHPGIFTDGASMDMILDSTRYVERQGAIYAATVAQHGDSERNDWKAALNVQSRLMQLVETKGILTGIFHTPGTAWFFEIRAKTAVALVAMDDSAADKAHAARDRAYRALMCPLLILAPDHNEVVVAPKFITHPEDDKVLGHFEDQFRAFLINTKRCKNDGKVMTLTCDACSCCTTGLLTHCKTCNQNVCDQCVTDGKCLCNAVPASVEIRNNCTLAEAMSLSDEGGGTNTTEFMLSAMRHK